MFHEQFANYYDFLALRGYKRCHEYHFFEETCAFRSLNRYFINHYGKLIPAEKVEDPKVIPDNWYKYTRQAVEPATKVAAVKNGLQSWVEWEKETKSLYEQMYGELMELGEVAAATKVHELICNADCELKKTERYHLSKKAADFSIADIMADQEHMHDKYKKKSRKLGVYIC